MATVRDIARFAMQRLRLLGSGEDPTDPEATDCLSALQSMYDTWAAGGLFGRLNDVIPTGNYTANEWDRVLNDGNYTITLPTTIQPNVPWMPYYPDQTVQGILSTITARPPFDLTMIEVVANGASTRSLYDTQARGWVHITGLALGDTAPLSSRGANGLASCLALAVADDFGATAGPGIQRAATLFEYALSARQGSARRANMADYF
jgi:hypothetical protein